MSRLTRLDYKDAVGDEETASSDGNQCTMKTNRIMCNRGCCVHHALVGAAEPRVDHRLVGLARPGPDAAVVRVKVEAEPVEVLRHALVLLPDGGVVLAVVAHGHVGRLVLVDDRLLCPHDSC